ncbi:hypothetical protein, partial [Phytoactinopolyspora endophytica]|uniref:hypothetical protein n=1 Tax=Phytoactinopolyspora endophytica TaxID=1642495 RepID=UPI0013EB4BEC
SVEVPQEHFEQLARILAANNRRLESAIDDLSRRLDPDGEHSRTAEPGRPGDELEALSVLGNATRTRL